MQHERQFYIDGKWVDPHSQQTAAVVNPANEEVVGTIVLGDQVDVDAAVAAARQAFPHFAQTTVDERAALLERIIDVYTKRLPDLAAVISQEMGAPLTLANAAQAPAGLRHFQTTLAALQAFEWEKDLGHNRIVHEPIGVCGF